MTHGSRDLKFGALVLVSLIFGWKSFLATISLAVHNQEYTHLLLVVPVSACLIWLQWKSLSPSFGESPTVGGVLLGFAAVLGIGVQFLQSATTKFEFTMVALILWWVGSFVFCFGLRASRSVLFPLLFLFCMVPIPQPMLARAVTFLQWQSASITESFFTVASVPVQRNGVVLSIPGLDVEVAAECSSIRSSLMLLFAALVLAHLFLRTLWSKLILVVLAVPLSVVKNGLRIFALTMLGTRVNPGFLTGRLHHQGGIVFFVVALGVLMILLWLLQRLEARPLPQTKLRVAT